MDLSALIFVALAAAWAAYLIPKALQYHEADQRSRTVEAFSSSMRVLARREPVDSKSTRLVPAAPRPAVAPAPAASTQSSKRAARRRRRVLGLLLLATVAVGVLAWLRIVEPPYLAVPGGLLALWLVVCRLSVRTERRRKSAAEPVETQATTWAPPADDAVPAEVEAPVAAAEPIDDEYQTEEVPVVAAPIADAPGSWDPVPVTLPTYVAKETAARRSVRTIDLDSTGVWSSGHSATDAELARQADESVEAPESADAPSVDRRASGA